MAESLPVPAGGLKSLLPVTDDSSDIDYTPWDELLGFYAKESTEGSESEIASILADQTRGELDLLYDSELPESEKAAVLADYLQRSGFSADIVPQLSDGQFTKEDVVSTLAKYGYSPSGESLQPTADPTDTPYLQNLLGLNLPIDGDYSEEEQALVRQGIEAGDFTVTQAADFFGIDPAIAQAAYDAPQVPPTPVTVPTEAELAQQAFDEAEEAFRGAVDDLNAWNQGQSPGSYRPTTASGAYTDQSLEDFYIGQREAQEALRVAQANYEAVGGNPDPFLNQVLSGVATVGGSPNLGTTGGSSALPGFNQIVWSIPSLIEGQPTFTGLWSDSGPNTPINIGKSNGAIIAATTGIPALDEAINTATGGAVINADGTLNTPSIGSIGDAAGDLITSGGITEVIGAASKLNVTGDANNENTEGVVGIGGYDFSDSSTDPNDSTSVVNSTVTTDAGDPIGPTLTSTAADDSTSVVNSTVTTDAGDPIGPTLPPKPDITFTPTTTETVTNRTAPTLNYTPGQQQEATTTLNDALSVLLASDTTSSQTYNDALETVLAASSLAGTTTLSDLNAALAGESTFKTNASGSLAANLAGQTETSKGAEGTLKGTLGGQTEEFSTYEATLETGQPLLAATLRGSGGSGGSGGTSQQSGVRTVSGGPGPLVDIDYLYDFEDSLLQPFRVTDDEDEIEGRQVKRFNTGGFMTDQEITDLTGVDFTNTGGNTETRGKLSQFVGDNAGALLTSAVGGLFGLLDNDEQQPSGYQGAIPDYQFNRTLKENAFSAVNPDGSTRRPGSMGRSYFDYGAVPFTGTGVIQGVGIPAAVATDTGGIADLDTSAFTSTGTAPAVTLAPTGTTTAIDPTSTFTAGDATSDIVNTVLQNELNTYLQGLGYGLEPKPVTAADIQSAVGAGYSLADVAGAFGTTPDILNQVLNPTSTTTTAAIDPTSTFTAGDTTSDIVNTVLQNELNTYLQGLGYGLEPKTVTAADIQSALNNGFSLEDVAGAFGTTESILNNILDPTSAVTTAINPISTYTAGDPTSSSETTIASTPINTYLQGLGYGLEPKPVTAADIQSALDNGFSLEDVAGAFSTTEVILNRILNPTSTNTTGDASSSTYTAGTENITTVDIENAVRDYLTANRGFTVGTQKEITQDDLKALKDQGFTVAEIAAGLNASVADVNTLLTYEYAAGGLTSLGGNVNGYYLGGPTDGMADQIPATIDNRQPAALSDGEFVIPADVVSHLGNGNSDAGAQNLYSMMERVRTDRTGNPNQGKQINPNQYLA